MTASALATEICATNLYAQEAQSLPAPPQSLIHADVSSGFKAGGLVKSTALEEIVVTAERRDGYIQPSGYDDADSEGARVKVLVKPNRDLSILLGADYLQIDGVGRGGAAHVFHRRADQRVGSVSHRPCSGSRETKAPDASRF